MAYPGHRWQMLRVTLVLVEHLIRQLPDLPLAPADQDACRSHLERAYRLIESDRAPEAADAVRDFLRHLPETGSPDGATPRQVADAVHAANRLAGLLEEP